MGNELGDLFYSQRMKMVEDQILKRGAVSSKVVKAFLNVPRHHFVPNDIKKMAYEDSPLPIGLDQTISQPYIVALMTEFLEVKKNHKVLEVGTGSGYQTAILNELSKSIYSVEIREEFSMKVQTLFDKMDIKGVQFKVGDGSHGWKEEAPFDRIIVTAAPKKVPEELLKQLAPSGKMIIPLGGDFQNLFLFEKNSKSELTQKLLLPVVFVPMVQGQIYTR
ncbi:MAG: protein-L-isoaspartate(D-aspartate) O-methyltransferase [Bdellovibrionota bacterium]|nr:protein-L-isoaspartate(D-aspartate) O-methyltransferase [Bdellovibrionota bacterium]